MRHFIRAPTQLKIPLLSQFVEEIMMFTTIIERNNEAVAFLREQDFSKAIERSWEVLKEHRSRQAVLREPYYYSISSRQARTTHIDHLNQCMLLSDINCRSATTDAEGVVFIYRNGILLHSEMTDPNMITPVLIFNSSLAFHMLAIQYEEDNQKELAHQALQKARRLYTLAYDACDNLDHNLLFQFVLINNLAMIDRQLRTTSIRTGVVCLRHLFAIYMLFLDQRCERCICNIYKAFLLIFNCLILAISPQLQHKGCEQLKNRTAAQSNHLATTSSLSHVAIDAIPIISMN